MGAFVRFLGVIIIIIIQDNKYVLWHIFAITIKERKSKVVVSLRNQVLQLSIWPKEDSPGV